MMKSNHKVPRTATAFPRCMATDSLCIKKLHDLLSPDLNPIRLPATRVIIMK